MTDNPATSPGLEDTKVPSIRIAELSFRDGSKLAVGRGDLVVVMGPNNSGKSLFLRELQESLRDPSRGGRNIIDTSRWAPDCTGDELRKYFENRYNKRVEKDHLSIGDIILHDNWFEKFGTDNHPLAEGARFFVELIGTERRISYMNPVAWFDRTNANPTHPIQYMWRWNETERDVSAKFRSAFLTDLVVHPQAGPQIPLYVGERPSLEKDENFASTSYLSRIEQLPRLEQQGDGMRSFATIVASLVALETSIILIDEPEAFLHPPQARLLGRIVAEARSETRQIFVATHSSDFLKGVMESNPQGLHVGRLVRGNRRQITWIDPSRTKQFLQDPLLRTTNALDAMLHEETILTEGDRDSVFYQAILDALPVPPAKRDRLFLHTGGKARFPSLALALMQLGVRPKIIADLDLIHSEDSLKSLIEALDADPTPIIEKTRQLVAQIKQRAPPIKPAAFKLEIENALSSIDTGPKSVVPEKVAKDIGRTLKKLSVSSVVKEFGDRAFKGQCKKIYNETERELAAIGIWLVPIGELEGFLSTDVAKGQGWLVEALGRPLATDPDLEQARNFVAKVFASNPHE